MVATTSYISYTDIPSLAISQIMSVINMDEGGFKFNDEAGGDWNYAGMLSENFIYYYNNEAVKTLIQVNFNSIKDWIEGISEEARQELTIELYYNKFYLPLLAIIAGSEDNHLPLAIAELSCAINCGLNIAKTIIDAPSCVHFYDQWEDYYIKLVTDNAIAWQKYAVLLSSDETTEEAANTPEPHPLRAPNLQGWINRVRRYRDVD